MDIINRCMLAAYFGVRNFIYEEAKRIKDDESGMELIQVILIVLMVVVIAAALWAFLGDWVTELLERIFQTDQAIGVDPGMNPR